MGVRRLALLRGEPGETYRVKGPQHDPKVEKVKADENGVIRDGRGRSYSSGSYEVLDDD
jgi:hypothetical protein